MRIIIIQQTAILLNKELDTKINGGGQFYLLISTLFDTPILHIHLMS